MVIFESISNFFYEFLGRRHAKLSYFLTLFFVNFKRHVIKYKFESTFYNISNKKHESHSENIKR